MNNPSQSENPDPDSTQLQQQHQSSQFQNPVSFDHQNNAQTLEISTIQTPQESDPTRLVADQEGEEFSGMVQESSTKWPYRRNLNKRKKAVVYKKQKAIDKKVQNLLQSGTLIPFVPLKRFDFDKHAELFKRLGLWDFVHIEFDQVIRDDLVSQFIVSYDAAKKCCFVNGIKVDVNRSKFARVLKLPSPIKKDKVVGSVAEEAIDLDFEVSEECVELVEGFVFSWVVLRGDDWITPNEVKGWMKLIRDGHPEKVDWATLIWVMVENELKQRDQLSMCYYASHLQYFLKSQRKDFFDEESEDVVVNEEMKEEKALNEEEIHKVKVEEVKNDEVLLEEGEKVMDDRDLLRVSPQEVDEKEVNKGIHAVEVEEVKEGPYEEGRQDEGAKKDSSHDLCKEGYKFVIEKPTIGLTLGQQDIVQKEEIKDDTRMAGEKGLEIKYDRQCYLGCDKAGKHFLQPCIVGEGRGYNGNEEMKQEVGQVEMEEEEHMVEGERIHEWENMEEGEHMEAEDGDELEEDVDELEEDVDDMEEDVDELEEDVDVDELEEDVDELLEEDEMGEEIEVEDEDDDEEEEEEEDEDEEELENGVEYNIAPSYGSVEGANLTGDLLHGFETAQLPLNLQVQKNSSMELSNTGTQAMVGCPSMFGNGHGQNSSMELFTKNAGKQMMVGCPSMFGNGQKRVFDCEQGTSHLDGSKRIRTDVGYDLDTSDFRSCMDKARQYMERAKIIYEEKDQACNQADVNQQYLLQELQRRDSFIESLQRNKNEELQKKDREIYRLERELVLLGELVNGYREALKVNRNMFFEYRQQCKVPEEPIYKDAGSGGLVLSTTDLEKQRQQQENEDRLMIEQKFNEALKGYVNQFQMLFRKVQMLDVNRLTPVVNEVKLLKELYAARHRAPETPDCVPPETTPPSE